MNQGESSSGLSLHPLKRRRGRPPKDPSLKRAAPGPRPEPRLNRTDTTESMVGQAVTGVVEATLDAGYLLNVRIGNSPMSFRGIVFKPGHFVPVTAENDVAPHLQMIKRTNAENPAQQLAVQTGPPPKRKYTSRRAAVPPATPPSSSVAPPAGPARGNVVPVMLQPMNHPNGSNQVLDFGDKDVHMVEPLSMLPPDVSRSIPAGQIFMGGQAQGSHGIPSGGGEQRKEVKPVESSDVENGGSSETSESMTDNSKEGSDIFGSAAHETGTNGESFSNEVSVTKPYFNCGPGRMTDLLQAVEMKENQVQFAEQPIPGSEVELREATMTIETDLKNEASGP
ncbi:hypothetical protein PHJA_001957600 [Phtheirospermum japonicum]|uniref:AT hook motif-containing protein n=1 Tax=Phtheirospermum japonicum TaxID=374723 RepID=A0A830CFX1_9LAMI|nr:hypothetical protein PHJA_001957600 [Phtheirospermum japonicum]